MRQPVRSLPSIKKVIIAAVISGVFALYSFRHVSAPLVPTVSDNPSSNSQSSSGSGSGATGPSSSGGATYTDGTYTGGAADAQWGYIQVQATISGGRLTNVQFLQYPNERQRSVEINAYADPQLTQEAIQAQSAQVDIISGATDSSEAFMQSLSDALTQAQA
jgi:uncharacterized protein with FMN-binding domain